MISRLLRFIKTPMGGTLMFLLSTFLFFYFVREYRERKARAADEKSKAELLGRMSPEAQPISPDKPITSEWVQDNRLDRIFAKTPEEEAAQPQETKPAAKPVQASKLPELVHVAEKPTPKATRAPAFKPPKIFAPPGVLLPCQLVVTVDSGSLETPVIGLLTEDLWHNGQLIVPAGTEAHAFAKRGRARDRIEVQGTWRLVWLDGRELEVSGIALHCAHDPEKDAYEVSDGSAGLKGQVLKSDEFLEYKLFAATALGAAARASEETTETLLGSKPKNSLENAGLEGASAVADRYAHLLIDQIDGDGLYVRVPAGTDFYIYTLELMEPKQASVAGWKQREATAINAPSERAPEIIDEQKRSLEQAEAIMKQREALYDKIRQRFAEREKPKS